MIKRKKIFLIALSANLVLFLILIGIYFYRAESFKKKYIGWQTATILDFGEFKIPSEWIFTEKDNVIYITDKPITEEDYNIYLIEVIAPEKQNSEYKSDNPLAGSKMERVKSRILSNEVSYGENLYTTETDEIVKRYATFASVDRSSNDIIFKDFLILDDAIGDDVILNIVKSYRMYR